jgi:hypothetical protein
MTSQVVRLVIGLTGVVALVAGIAALVGGDTGGMFLIVMGATALLVFVFEQARYRSEAAAPGPPYQRTDEAFVDPTTRRRTRVYVNPNTGERRYHVES